MKFTINKTAWLAGICTALMASSVYADTLRMAFQVSPSTIDPFKSSASATASLNEHIYEGLISRTNQKLLDTSYSWTDDTTLVVNLRKGVKFHNGADFTAEDVVYSSCRMMYRVGGKKNMLTSAMGPVTDVVAIDDYTVAFKTVGLYPILIQKLKSLSILDSGDADLGPTLKFDNTGDCGITRYPTKAEFESGKYANGTGKYKYESFSITGDANLVRNDEYWGEPGNWERVEIRSVENSGARMAGLLAGDYDLIENPTGEDLLALDGNPAYSYSTEPSWRSIFLILDVGSDVAPGVTAPDGSNPLKDIRVRKALSLSIDRAAIVEKLMGGNATVASNLLDAMGRDNPYKDKDGSVDDTGDATTTTTSTGSVDNSAAGQASSGTMTAMAKQIMNAIEHMEKKEKGSSEEVYQELAMKKQSGTSTITLKPYEEEMYRQLYLIYGSPQVEASRRHSLK
jgi:peptide/nickel transport system substrate-binding protein